MASNLFGFSRSSLTAFGLNYDIGLNLMCKRFVNKSPGQSQKGHRRPPKHFRLFVLPGQRVEERTIVGKQNNMRWHPGFNVAIDPKDKSLYSLCAGSVFYSIEKFNPNPKSGFVQQFYGQHKGPLYKKYIHVIRDKDPKVFKLVEVI